MSRMMKEDKFNVKRLSIVFVFRRETYPPKLQTGHHEATV